MTNLEKFIGRPLDDEELSAINAIMQLGPEKVLDILYARDTLHLIVNACISLAGARDCHRDCYNKKKTCFDCWMEEHKEVSK